MEVRNSAEVGLCIRERRRELGIDQRTLAARIGVSRQWVVAIEKGKARAEVGLVLRALTALGLAVDIRPTVAGPTEIDEIVDRARRRGR